MNMRASSSSKIKIRGFMCHSGANAVCMANDPRSVLMPRRAASRKYVDHAMLMNSNHNTNTNNVCKYSRLLDSHHQRFAAAAAAANRRKLAAINLQGSIKKDQDPGAREQKLKPKPLSAPTAQITDQAFQVVVMKVAIHCQGCAGKVKKHLSKMEGVTSFSIDVESRRVTVMGHVSPLLVVESVSKVKRAELWT